VGDSSQGSFLGIQIGKDTRVGGNSWKWWIVCTFVIISMSVVSIFGDLFFSWLKRKNNIKDFSGLLKDHGGILDRIDSLILTVTFFGLITTIVAFACTYRDQISLVFPTFIK
jgi:CDP-diglyceride synthetase